MVSLGRNRVLRTVGAALLLAAGVLAAPQRAAASCGDYVTVGGHGQPDSIPNAPHKPCHGPGCSADPDGPVPPASAPVTAPTSPDKGTAWLAGTVAEPGDHGGHPRPTSSGRPVRRPRAVFHPPPTA